MKPSPFPGMDPWLELHWGDVHHSLIQYSRDALQKQLPNDLLARVDERVFVEDEPEANRVIRPDVVISEAQLWAGPGAESSGGVAVANPLVFEVSNPEITEGYIEIRDRGGKVITVIEFLSPTNKRIGAGRDKYLEKQDEVLRSQASLVEIDLVRSGRRTLALPAHDIPLEHRADYLACVSPGWRRSRRLLYLMPLRQRLPVLPIPLRKGESPVPLDLQTIVNEAYVQGRYETLDYGVDLDPPLTTEDAVWAQTLWKSAKPT